jgi:hypothetical protein
MNVTFNRYVLAARPYHLLVERPRGLAQFLGLHPLVFRGSGILELHRPCLRWRPFSFSVS